VLDQLGTKEQKDKFLVGFADGTHVGCFGISEPGKRRIRNEYANNMAGGLESVLWMPSHSGLL
jgi:alkylation response protein AidB-like acyl-CoA dehydrogenase